ncbi:D-alanyl-D-alanine carboxypeptidase [Microbacterium sp. B35-30]|uniref:D-alanyl-D-alanine carboxypeptidase family protein n=1 Tax=Microbacterium sp. B35-30 TaxID=1962642 RepID=UPI0013CFD6E9|nr:D-alanyl-D-alanine carboxypeptidase [Microbacterium sp. B35-30]KAF2415511.1 D-alanyl-D-alanine carboxypeptidase [Microbacterium sp. B35-30]
MTLDDAPVPTRRARRAQTGDVPIAPGSHPSESGILTVATGETVVTPPGSSTAPDDVPAIPSTIATVPLGDPAATSPTVPVFEAAPVVAAAPVFQAAPVFEAAPQTGSVIPGLVPEPTVPVATWDPTGHTALPETADDRVERAATAGGRMALTWVDETTVGRAAAPGDLAAATTPYVTVDADLLSDAPRRSPLRAGVVVPTLAIAAVFGAYAATTLLWPLHAVAPTVIAMEVQPIAAPAATPVWPAEGSAAEGVAGISGTLASSADPDAIASITKVVTALVVLEEMPLALGEQGPEFRFTSADRSRYWQYLSNGESALNVPVNGSLTEYQMLEGILVGSANNYADRLAQSICPSDAVFASAASSWLAAHGVPGVTVFEPTGMDPRNTASAEALVVLAQKALAHPVIAEIVAKQSVDLPGAGNVKNTNGLLADPGVVGIKTGTLDAWNLLSAKDITVGDTTVRLYASVLGQPDDEARLAASRAIYAQLEAELQLKPSVTANTVAGQVETLWGDEVDVITSGDASVILWNGGSGTVTPAYDLDESRDAGDVIGSLTVTGPLDETAVDLQLAADITEPSPWWRLTHPLDLFGLNG